jgi:hypothetical protein
MQQSGNRQQIKKSTAKTPAVPKNPLPSLDNRLDLRLLELPKKWGIREFLQVVGTFID